MILHQIRLGEGRAVDDTDLSDLFAAERTGSARWFECEEHGGADCLLIPMKPSPSAKQARAIRRRLVTKDAADEGRLLEMIAMRGGAPSPFQRLYLDTELARYGE